MDIFTIRYLMDTNTNLTVFTPTYICIHY